MAGQFPVDGSSYYKLFMVDPGSMVSVVGLVLAVAG